MDWNLEEPPCYLEVEYIEGGSLADWAQSADGLATTPQAVRIELIAQIAEALAAAHSVGVLHKDLKPGNVLITPGEDGQPTIRLADFGSGYLTDPDRLDALDITKIGFTLARDDASSGGTALYLAPELLRGQAPTARSDIYALGVMLYQLLVGDLRKPLAVGWEQDIADELLREDISAAAEGRPQHRLGDAAELARRLRGLEARRHERQAQASERERASTLQAALEHARTRRRRLGAISAVLGVMLAVVTVLLIQVQTARELAREETDIAAAVNEFLTTDLLGQANPMIAGRRDVSVREILDVAAEEASRRFVGRQSAEAGVRLALGSAYRNLAEYERAERELRLAEQLAASGARSSTVAEQALLELGRLHVSRDQPTLAIEVVGPLRESALPQLQLHARIINATALKHRGEFEPALAELQQLLPLVEAHFGQHSPVAIAVLGHQAVALEKLSRYEDSLVLHQRELDALHGIYGDGHVQTLRALRGLSTGHFMMGRLSEALSYTRRAHEIAVTALGAEHDDTLRIASDLGLIYGDLGEDALGEEIMLATLETRVRLYGEASRDARSLLNNLGLFYGERGDVAREIEYVGRAYHADREAAGERDPATLVSAHNFARAMVKAGRLDEAETLERETLAIAREVFGPTHVYVGIMEFTLANILGKRGEFEIAEAKYAAAIERLDNALEPGNSWSARAQELRDEMRKIQASLQLPADLQVPSR